MAISAIWKITYRAAETTLAPILINFSCNVVKDQWLTALDRASRRWVFVLAAVWAVLRFEHARDPTAHSRSS